MDGEKHTVCIIKAEGKPRLSREFSSLAIHDPLISRDATQSVRVLVVSTTGESAGVRFHMGWRGTVTKASPSGQVRVSFPYLSQGKVLSRQVNVPRERLQILTDDDVSMAPNQHPWVGRSVTVQEGLGEVVRVTDQGRVKIKVAQDGVRKKKIVVVESRGASFDELFNNSASPADAPSQAAPMLQAAPILQPAEEEVAEDKEGE